MGRNNQKKKLSASAPVAQHVVTGIDLAANPDLAGAGVVVGDNVEIRVVDNVPSFLLRADTETGRRILFLAYHQIGHRLEGEDRQLLAEKVREFELFEESTRTAAE